MSDKDTTDPELDAPRAGTTNPMLERILEEMREGFATLNARVDRGFTELRADLSRSRAAAREDLALEAKDLNERMASLERRMLAIEEAGRPQ